MAVTNENMPSSFAAEALARVQSLQWGFDLGFLDVEVEGGPLIVIIKLRSKDEDKSEIGAYIRDGKILEQIKEIVIRFKRPARLRPLIRVGFFRAQGYRNLESGTRVSWLDNQKGLVCRSYRDKLR
ncbi:hypothetical protein Godav_023588, partial [Gossypium davidsonii]|nr:hypothetical protein [Gossypium davidsonii]